MAPRTFPVIGAPIPNDPGSPPIPLPPVPGTEPFIPPVQAGPAPEAGWQAMLQDPKAIMALLQFAGGALQPKGIGDTSAGIVGKALAGATQSFMDQSNLEKEQADKQARTGLLERQVAVEEGNAPYGRELQKQQAGYYSRMPEEGRGSYKDRLAALEREDKIKWFERTFGLDRTDAIGQLAIAESNDYATVGGVGAIQAMLKELEGGIEIAPEDRMSMQESLKQFTLEPVQPMPELADDQVSRILASPQATAEAVKRWGPEPWRQRVAKLKGK